MQIIVQDDDGTMIAHITVARVSSTLPDEQWGAYQVRYSVDRGKDVWGLYQRGLTRFPRLRQNCLGLIKRALALLDESKFDLESGAAPCDLRRGEPCPGMTPKQL